MSKVDWPFWLQWVLATTMGWVVGWFVMDWLYIAVTVFATGAVIGASAGIPRWFVLRCCVTQSVRWIAASAAGGALGGLLSPGWGRLPILAAMGAVPGAVTGGMPIWLLRHPVLEAEGTASGD